VGADPAVHVGWDGPYDVDTTFHEPFVLFGYLAAITSLELVTGIIILPQRQTALVAKQAAEVDLLTEGRFRLGVGLGWNAVEYEALGKDFSDRGRRITEQVELLRRLWTERSVTFTGQYETVTGAGLAPLPVQRPIPIWFGANVPAAMRRVGRLADGWFPQAAPGPRLDAALAEVRAGAEEVGRDPSAIEMEGRIGLARGVDVAADHADRWRQAGATHLGVNTMGLVPTGPVGIDRHIGALAELADALSLPRGPIP
jgi:probable F420-dependent oxidoreductase